MHYRLILLILFTLFKVTSFLNAEVIDDEKWIELLKKYAIHLEWSGSVFVSRLEGSKTGKIFGISEKSISSLDEYDEKSLVQIIVDEPEALDQRFIEQRDRYKEAQFAVQPLEGLGIPAYIAYCVYYVSSDQKTLTLGRSIDLIELRLPDAIVTFRDERLSLDANARGLFQKWLSQDWIELKSKEIDLVSTKKFANLPKNIILENIFPNRSQLPWGEENWLFQIDRKGEGLFGQSFAQKIDYEYTGPHERSSKPIIQIFFNAFGRLGQADIAYELLKNRFNDDLVFKDETHEYADKSIMIIHDTADLHHLLMVKGIFFCEIRVYWKASLPEEREALLKICAEYMNEKLNSLWKLKD